VPRSIRDPITSNEVNVVGTLNILHAAKDASVKRVVFASSSSIYGETPELPKHEGMMLAPLSPYAVSKLAAEKYCSVFTKVYGWKRSPCVISMYSARGKTLHRNTPPSSRNSSPPS
jgi:UDP-glucose 4-epimerase